MKILFIYSELDPAGLNLASKLMNFIDFRSVSRSVYTAYDGEWILLGVNKGITYTDYIDRDLDADVNIFLSRHSSQSGLKTLSVHPTGNPNNEAALGGVPMSLAPCHPPLMNLILQKLFVNNLASDSDYKVTLEVTHHGPTELRNPSLFVEIGSTENEWRDEYAAEIVIKSLLDAIELYEGGGYESKSIYVGFGGPHYAPRFTNAVLNKGLYVGHILSKYSLEKGVSNEVLIDAFKKSMEAGKALIDWKGIRAEPRRRLLIFLDTYGIPYERA